MKTIYECEYCGYQSTDKKEVKKCEDEHWLIEDMKIKKFLFKEGYDIPSKLIVEIGGSTVTFINEEHYLYRS